MPSRSTEPISRIRDHARSRSLRFPDGSRPRRVRRARRAASRAGRTRGRPAAVLPCGVDLERFSRPTDREAVGRWRWSPTAATCCSRPTRRAPRSDTTWRWRSPMRDGAAADARRRRSRAGSAVRQRRRCCDRHLRARGLRPRRARGARVRRTGAGDAARHRPGGARRRGRALTAVRSSSSAGATIAGRASGGRRPANRRPRRSRAPTRRSTMADRVADAWRRCCADRYQARSPASAGPRRPVRVSRSAARNGGGASARCRRDRRRTPCDRRRVEGVAEELHASVLESSPRCRDVLDVQRDRGSDRIELQAHRLRAPSR